MQHYCVYKLWDIHNDVSEIEQEVQIGQVVIYKSSNLQVHVPFFVRKSSE